MPIPIPGPIPSPSIDLTRLTLLPRPHPPNPRLHRPLHRPLPQMEPLEPRRPHRLDNLLQAIPLPPHSDGRANRAGARRPAPALRQHDRKGRRGGVPVSGTASGSAHEWDSEVEGD